MTVEASASESFSVAAPANLLSRRRLSIGFLNWAHALDHFVMLIFPAIVIGLEAVSHRPYAEMIALSTAAFVAFGVFSLPAGLAGRVPMGKDFVSSRGGMIFPL